MERGPAKISVKELRTGTLYAKDLEVAIGRLAMEEEWEPMGPTPMPSLTTLRSWDRKLLSRYTPFYMPFCDLCCLCTYGKCDLTRGKKGACGLDLRTQQARIILIACCIGASTHTAHARHLVHYLLEKYGPDYPINLGTEIEVEAPHIRLVTGIRPKTLGDLAHVLNYCEEQITHSLAATHTGQEGDYIDYESKALHVSMIDHVAMEAADIAQVVGFNFPKGDPNAPLVESGLGILADTTKPVVLLIGHNVCAGVELVDYIRKAGLGEAGTSVEVAGICCTSHDITRYTSKAKIIGPISYQSKFVRSGIADVVVVDEQCIRTDIPSLAASVNTPVIAVSEKVCYGFPDVSDEPVDRIVDMLVTGKLKGALILDLEKAGAVAALTAIRIAPLRRKFKAIPDVEKVRELASPCTYCHRCRRNCPSDLPVSDAVNAAKQGVLDKLADLHDVCLGCLRCESECPQKIPILSLMEAAAQHKIKTEKYKVRAGRGPILDTEIREVGSPIVLGEIPGVVAYVGCANYPGAGRDVGEMAYEFAKRGYIVVASGCSAMSIGEYRDEEGRTPYEAFPGVFDRGGLVNVGSCVANAHISGAAIKIASIFARRKLRANYEEIADYVLHRVGACGVAWGAYSQKAASIATGYNRLGIPVIIGPQGSKYRRLYLGRVEDVASFETYDARTGQKVYIGPAPEHLVYIAETKEECMVWTAKLCMRPNDTTKGRMIKLTHYIDLYRRLYGRLPDDLPLLVRTEADVPITFKDEVMDFLKGRGWKPAEVPSIDPTLLERLIRVRK
ncbi:MAG: CO dehydrogenase/acetyl-CoA synthase complex subunit alpha [Candidatus Nezhaarchaeales archaeon]